MATPPNAFVIARPMDPRDIEVFGIDLSQGAADTDLLLEGEDVAQNGLTLALTSDAVAAGMLIKTGGSYTIELDGLDLKFYLTVDDARVGDAQFEGTGINAALDLTVTTNATPPRRKHKTIIVKVAKQ